MKQAEIINNQNDIEASRAKERVIRNKYQLREQLKLTGLDYSKMSHQNK